MQKDVCQCNKRMKGLTIKSSSLTQHFRGPIKNVKWGGGRAWGISIWMQYNLPELLKCFAVHGIQIVFAYYLKDIWFSKDFYVSKVTLKMR